MKSTSKIKFCPLASMHYFIMISFEDILYLNISHNNRGHYEIKFIATLVRCLTKTYGFSVPKAFCLVHFSKNLAPIPYIRLATIALHPLWSPRNLTQGRSRFRSKREVIVTSLGNEKLNACECTSHLASNTKTWTPKGFWPFILINLDQTNASSLKANPLCEMSRQFPLVCKWGGM